MTRSDQTKPRRARRILLIPYVVLGSVALFLAMLAISILMLPEGGFVSLPSKTFTDGPQ
jgi:hypothetical protein